MGFILQSQTLTERLPARLLPPPSGRSTLRSCEGNAIERDADRLILQGRVSESDLTMYFLSSQLLLARGFGGRTASVTSIAVQTRVTITHVSSMSSLAGLGSGLRDALNQQGLGLLLCKGVLQ